MKRYNKGFTRSVENGLVQSTSRPGGTRPFFTAGFTLIEMLMYVVIVGILSSVVMSSIRIARDKGADAAIQENLISIRTEAQNYFDSNQSYGTPGTSCTNIGSLFADPVIARQLNSATRASGLPAVCANSATAWVVSMPLRYGNSWCVDSASAAKDAIADTVAIACP